MEVDDFVLAVGGGGDVDGVGIAPYFYARSVAYRRDRCRGVLRIGLRFGIWLRLRLRVGLGLRFRLRLWF